MREPAPEANYDLLVDPRYGIIGALDLQPHRPEVPATLVSYTARVCNSQRLGRWQGDRASMGAAFHHGEWARRAAIGEAVERYCGNFIPAKALRRASYRDLRAAGETAVDPEEFVLYSRSQYETPGFPFVPLTPDLPVQWVEGRDLGTGETVLVPASLVYVNYFVGALEKEPQTNFVMYAGIAAGAGREAAEFSALEELIERDATMIWWMTGCPAAGIPLADEPALLAAVEPAATADPAEALAYHVFEVPSPFGMPVLGALVEDRHQQLVGLGFACRPEPLQAALKAIIEAIAVRYFCLGLLDPRGDVWRAAEAGVLDGRVFKPWREDRAYLDSYRSDFRDVTDLTTQSQIYLDPRMHHHVRRVIEPASTKPLSAVPPLPRAAGREGRAACLEGLAKQGLRAISVDVTTPDVALSGLRVVRVLVPGLYPNAPAAFPCLGGRRLYEEPYQRGLMPRVLTEDDLILAPLPHT